MKPIIFSTDMVKAILDGRKTQTRRVLNPHPAYIDKDGRWYKMPSGGHSLNCYPCPYGQVGDRLWVRETHYLFGAWVKNGISKTGRQKWRFNIRSDKVLFFDNPPKSIETRKGEGILGWYKRPSIFMPRWASRITLETTNIRVERLQEITIKDGIQEGIDCNFLTGTVFPEEFIKLWDSINKKKHPWKDNPWVWVIEFKGGVSQWHGIQE